MTERYPGYDLDTRERDDLQAGEAITRQGESPRSG
jgi:hypothetical protein